MPDFEFEFNQQDKDLVVSQNNSSFVSGEKYSSSINTLITIC